MSEPDRILRSRRVVLPQGERPACVVVREGRIAAIEPWDAALAVTDELGELALMPGIVDTHVHVNEPGRTDWEGFHSATMAAAAGGVTTIVDMPLNSVPATTSVEGLRAKVAAMAGQLHVDVGLWGGVVPHNETMLAPLAAAGVLGFKCFLSPSGVDEFEHVSFTDLDAALAKIARLALPLLAHAEDPALLGPLPASTRRHADWLASRPPAAEASAVRGLIELSQRHDAHVHVVHVASAEVLHVVSALLGPTAHRGRLTLETCPHYLMFSAEEIADGATAFKCAPPIRGADEQRALQSALMSGRIQLVASDHSPAPAELKHAQDGDFAAAWGGIASLQIALPVVWTAMEHYAPRLDAHLSAWMSAAPASLAGLSQRKGAIAPGRDADLVAFDPDARWTVDQRELLHRHKLTPYHRRTLRGRVTATWLRGRQVFDGHRVVGEPQGRWLRAGTPGGAGPQAVDPAGGLA